MTPAAAATMLSWHSVPWRVALLHALAVELAEETLPPTILAALDPVLERAAEALATVGPDARSLDEIDEDEPTRIHTLKETT